MAKAREAKSEQALLSELLEDEFPGGSQTKALAARLF